MKLQFSDLLFKKNLKLRNHLLKKFLGDEWLLGSVQTTLDLRKERLGFLNRDLNLLRQHIFGLFLTHPSTMSEKIQY